MAQRLCRRLCPRCRQEVHPSEAELLSIGFTEEEINQGLTIYGPGKGCEQCHGGYKGRVGVYELLVMSEPIAQAIMSGANSLEIEKLAQQEGMQTLKQSALEKVKLGLTSLDEVRRVVS